MGVHPVKNLEYMRHKFELIVTNNAVLMNNWTKVKTDKGWQVNPKLKLLPDLTHIISS